MATQIYEPGIVGYLIMAMFSLQFASCQATSNPLRLQNDVGNLKDKVNYWIEELALAKYSLAIKIFFQGLTRRFFFEQDMRNFEVTSVETTAFNQSIPDEMRPQI